MPGDDRDGPNWPHSTASADRVLVRWHALQDIAAVRLDTLLSILDKGERQRAQRFAFEQDRSAYIAAHALKRIMLSEACARDPRCLRFASGRFGKPELAADEGADAVQFSISHCTSMVAVAISIGAPVGIDVESLDRDWHKSAESFLSPYELADLRRAPYASQRQAIASAWTLKEAFAKATGMGLSQPLDRLQTLSTPPSIGFSADDPDDPDDWSFGQLAPDARHVISLAVARGDVGFETGAAATPVIRATAHRRAG